MAEPKLCETCRAFMLDLLEKRITRILEVSHEEGGEEEESAPGSQCFHLMEIERILEGKPTCGVYDDYGRVPQTPAETSVAPERNSAITSTGEPERHGAPNPKSVGGEL